MITVLESIKLASDYLQGKEIESARINAELLLADILKCKRLDLYLLFDRPLSDHEVQQYRNYLKRRSNFEPLQYIIGKVEFFGLELEINSSVLIPRPETEQLVESIINQLSREKEYTILDIGCGSGNISIALAASMLSVKLFTIDNNENALLTARKNAEKNNVANKIKFIYHDVLKDDFDNFPMFDLVVSNPPYVSAESFLSLQKEITDFEPRNAVTDDSDGYKFFNAISEKVKVRLKPNGKLFFEIAESQRERVFDIMKQNGFINITSIKDYQNIDRIIYGELG